MFTQNNKSTYALSVQKKVGIFDYPFTLNPFIGCQMQCSYCFVPGPVIKIERSDFFTKVQVKENLLVLLQKELAKYANLPQHLKRVQFGVTTELFQPKVINYMTNNLGYDLLEEIFKLFKKEWDNDNKWMLHILTKNHNIVQYLPILINMKEMIQVEFSIIHHDENISRQYEKFTSSIKKRLEAIDKLSSNGIFVRVMAMPFFGDATDLDKLKDLVFNHGAAGFKNKSLNYYEWGQLNNIDPINPLSRTTTKTNLHIPSYIIKSGEEISPSKIQQVLLPKTRKRGDKFVNWANKPKDGLDLIDIPTIDMGYAAINNIDWNYIS